MDNIQLTAGQLITLLQLVEGETPTASDKLEAHKRMLLNVGLLERGGVDDGKIVFLPSADGHSFARRARGIKSEL